MACVAQAGVINDLVLLSCVGIRPVFVHGGGPEINTWLNKLGIEAEFKNGLRVTDGNQLALYHLFFLKADLAEVKHHMIETTESWDAKGSLQ